MKAVRVWDRPKVPLWAVMLVTYLTCAAGNVTIGKAGAGWPWMVTMDLMIGAIYGVVGR